MCGEHGFLYYFIEYTAFALLWIGAWETGKWLGRKTAG